MTGLDTNILVRFITYDDPRQASRARQIIEDELTPDEPGFVSLVTITKLAWVLESFYRFSNAQIAAAIELILRIDSLRVQNEREVALAMMALKSGAASFDDALIGSLGHWGGCSHTVTFDRKAARLPAFRLA